MEGNLDRGAIRHGKMLFASFAGIFRPAELHTVETILPDTFLSQLAVLFFCRFSSS